LLGHAVAAHGDMTFPVLGGSQTTSGSAGPVRQEGSRVNDTTSGADLAAKKLPELQAIAAGLGIKGARRLRKGELIDAIRGGGAPTASAASAPAASSDRKSTRLNSSHVKISYAVFCLKKK